MSSPTTIPALLPLSSGGLPDGAKSFAILAAPDVRAAILRHWASQYVTATANPRAGSTSNVSVRVELSSNTVLRAYESVRIVNESS